MDKPNTYTLEELAADFDLTPRTARHYIENVLPPHHKTGRGKLARYGQDTWNCFSFIQKVRRESGFTATHITDVLATLDQEQIDRVAEGREEMRIVTSPSLSASKPHSVKRNLPRASERAALKSTFKEPQPDFAIKAESHIMESREFSPHLLDQEAEALPSWKKLYADDQLRITFKGEANREQREQVDLAAKLISKILSGSG
jgi:DNA-binding transcriptional MerR regulator